jgi:hypothetical protein
MSQQARVSATETALLAPLARSGRWVYLLAVLLPAWSTLDAVLSPFPIQGHGTWLSMALVVVCLLQFFRPTLLLGLPVFVWYAWASAGSLWREIGAFDDYRIYGGEEHSRWEGWQTEWVFLLFTIFLASVASCVMLHILRRPRHAT